ncbi:Archaeal primase DnaG/twinkle, TOPRIM domain [uncultured Caudovirales phage]|uniref:Archaeal primase DnaG/twinkle, TOPRIM domain n=1 Tax=uncultured Caudovirales phage TaxID=2100421 RepID=A0A6J5RWG0_9CAUD|nr:Archaeal primase DnaG/twinkle, TOPRIM domain [uncultured Caudovirales phage]
MTTASPSQSPQTAPYGSATTAAGVAVFAPLEQKHLDGLEERGIDAETAVMLGVGASAKLPGDCIAFPFFDNGKHVATKYRTMTGEKRFTQDAGGAQIFWNVDCLRDESLNGQPVIITEGEFDAIAAIQSGYPRTISVPGGAPPEETDGEGKRYQFIDHAEELLRGCQEIILAVDADGAGANLLHDLRLRLGSHRCKFLSYPDETKDLNDVLQLYGSDAVGALIRSAKWIKVDGVYRLSDLPPVTPNVAYDCGMQDLWNHYRIRKGDFSVVTGLPGHGKTSFVNEITCRMAKAFKWNTCFASFEQSPQIDHRRALRSFHSMKLEKTMSQDERDRADAWIDERFSFLVPDEDDDITLQWFLEKAAAAVIRYNVDIMVLDPWNEMDHTRPKDMTMTEYVGFAIRQLRKFAKKYQVHLIVVAHPAKMLRAKDGKYPTPGLYDISDSAHWANKADIGVVVHRADLIESQDTSIRIVKSRYHQAIGKPGEIKGIWNEDTTRYTITEPTEG